MKKVLAVWLVLLAVVLGCGEGKLAEGVLEREKFSAIYVELMDSAAVIQKDSVAVQITPTTARILNRHQVTIDQLKRTVDYYNADTKTWKLFYEDVTKKVNERSMKNTNP